MPRKDVSHQKARVLAKSALTILRQSQLTPLNQIVSERNVQLKKEIADLRLAVKDLLVLCLQQSKLTPLNLILAGSTIKKIPDYAKHATRIAKKVGVKLSPLR